MSNSEHGAAHNEPLTEWYCAGCGEVHDERPGISCPKCPYVALIEREVEDG